MSTMPNVLSSWLKYEEECGDYSRDAVTILSGQNLASGAVLGKVTASGKYKAYAAAATDGSQTVAGILVAAVDASGGDTPGVAIVRHAIVADTNITYTGTKATVEAGLKALGIVPRVTV